jgi:hypothetical protein
LWGRAGGFIAGIINSAVEFFTGKDIGDHLYSAFFQPAKNATAVAARSASAENATTRQTLSSTVSTPDGLAVDSTAQPVTIQQVPAGQESLRGLTIASEITPQGPRTSSIPWPAASALHIFQRHERSSGREDAKLPIVRYVA